MTAPLMILDPEVLRTTGRYGKVQYATIAKFTKNRRSYDALKNIPDSLPNLLPRTEIDTSCIEGDIRHVRWPSETLWYYYYKSIRIQSVHGITDIPYLKACYFDTLTRISALEGGAGISQYIKMLALYKAAGVVLRETSSGIPFAPAMSLDPLSAGSIDPGKLSSEQLKQYSAMYKPANNTPYDFQNRAFTRDDKDGINVPVMTKIIPYPTMNTSESDRSLYGKAVLNIRPQLLGVLAKLTDEILHVFNTESDYSKLTERYRYYLNAIRSSFPKLNTMYTINTDYFTWYSRIPSNMVTGPLISFGNEWTAPAILYKNNEGVLIPLGGLEEKLFGSNLPCDIALERIWRESILDSKIMNALTLIESKIFGMADTSKPYIPARGEGVPGLDPNMVVNIDKSSPETIVFDLKAITPAQSTLPAMRSVKVSDFGGVSYAGLLNSLGVRGANVKTTLLSESRSGGDDFTGAKKANIFLWLAAGAAAAYGTYKASGG